MSDTNECYDRDIKDMMENTDEDNYSTEESSVLHKATVPLETVSSTPRRTTLYPGEAINWEEFNQSWQNFESYVKNHEEFWFL